MKSSITPSPKDLLPAIMHAVENCRLKKLKDLLAQDPEKNLASDVLLGTQLYLTTGFLRPSTTPKTYKNVLSALFDHGFQFNHQDLSNVLRGVERGNPSSVMHSAVLRQFMVRLFDAAATSQPLLLTEVISISPDQAKFCLKELDVMSTQDMRTRAQTVASARRLASKAMQDGIEAGQTRKEIILHNMRSWFTNSRGWGLVLKEKSDVENAFKAALLLKKTMQQEYVQNSKNPKPEKFFRIVTEITDAVGQFPHMLDAKLLKMGDEYAQKIDSSSGFDIWANLPIAIIDDDQNIAAFEQPRQSSEKVRDFLNTAQSFNSSQAEAWAMSFARYTFRAQEYFQNPFDTTSPEKLNDLDVLTTACLRKAPALRRAHFDKMDFSKHLGSLTLAMLDQREMSDAIVVASIKNSKPIIKM